MRGGILAVLCGLALSGEPEPDTSLSELRLVMPGAEPSREDDYLCSAFDVMALSGAADNKTELHVTGFKPGAEAEKAHHMLLYTCDEPLKAPGEVYDCLHHSLCKGGQSIMFAWAKNAPPTSLPSGVSFKLKPAERRFLVLQVHYAHPLREADHSGIAITVVDKAPLYTAGMFLLLRSHLNIPPNTPSVHGDVNCQANIKSPVHVFAYRTHAHSLGSVISGYRFSPSNKQWRMLAKGNPQWPQAFYPMENVETVNPGEILTARCTYNSTGHSTPTKIGQTAGDEMCNLYLMFYTVTPQDDFVVCVDEENTGLTSQLPPGSDAPLPPNPLLEHSASQETPLSYDNGQEEAGLQPPIKRPESSVRKRPGVASNGFKQPKALPGSDLSVVNSWPSKETESRLGQISGVAIDIYGNAVIFHRGDRTWNAQTFKGDNTYGMDRNTPIPVDTVFTVNSTGHIINSWGRNIFFLPHMITVDSKNNVWMTDVALHQIYKFSPYGGDHKPLIVLGERFVPGSDDHHYCKPTAVAVAEDTNSFFVSDGYCNSRVIKYGVSVDTDGKHLVKKLFEWGKGAGPFTVTQGPNSFNIPHGLALAEDKGEICVADRENGRVQCFTLEGQFTRSIQPPEFGSRIFSVAYTSANGGQLHAVSGPEFSLNPWAKKPTGYIISMESGDLAGTWNVPGGLQNPHDVAVSSDGSIVYVVELNPFKVWKLSTGAPQSAAVPPPNNLSTSGPSPSSVDKSGLQKGLDFIVDTDVNSRVLLAAALSIALSLFIAVCMAYRRCRRRGKGTMMSGTGGKGKKHWNVGDILGRSKDGFKPLSTDEGENMLDSDSDSEVEEFSIPVNHA